MPVTPKVFGHLDDYENTYISPTVSNMLTKRDPEAEVNIYSEMDELSKLRKDTSKLVYEGQGSSVFYGSEHWKKFSQYEQAANEVITKNAAWYAAEPDDPDVSKATLASLHAHGYIPMSSMFPQEDGSYNIPLNSITDGTSGKKAQNIPFDPLRMPVYSGNKQYSYAKLDSQNTTFFSNENELAKAGAAYHKNFGELQVTPKENLVETYNQIASKENLPSLDIDALPSGKADVVVAFADDWASSVGEEADPAESLGLLLGIGSALFAKPNAGLAPEEVDEKEEAITKQLDDLMGSNYSNRTPEQVRRFLISEISKYRWDKMGDKDKEAVSQYVGLAGRTSVYSDKIPVPVDASGRATFSSSDNSHSEQGLSYLQHRVVHAFEADQLKRLQSVNPPRYGADFFQTEAARLSEGVAVAMQQLIKDQNGNIPKGFLLSELEDVSIYALKGIGAQGASQQEMNTLVNAIAQYLSIRGEMAKRDMDYTKTIEEEVADGFTRNGQKRMYDLRPRLGVLDVDGGMWKEDRSRHSDPVINVVMDFIKEAENFVVLDKGKVVPMVQWFGLQTFDASNMNSIFHSQRIRSKRKMVLPNRVYSLKLLGTDVEASRKLAELSKRFESEKVEGTSDNE